MANSNKHRKGAMEKEYSVAQLFKGRDCARFIKEGMEGVERKKASRPVSMMSLASRIAVDTAEIRGLCYARFVADITLEGDQMPAKGDIIGTDDLQLGILQEGKRCWPECILLEKNLPCPLIEGVRYAWVEKPGSLCVGETFKFIKSVPGDPVDLPSDPD